MGHGGCFCRSVQLCHASWQTKRAEPLKPYKPQARDFLVPSKETNHRWLLSSFRTLAPGGSNACTCASEKSDALSGTFLGYRAKRASNGCGGASGSAPLPRPLPLPGPAPCDRSRVDPQPSPLMQWPTPNHPEREAAKMMGGGFVCEGCRGMGVMGAWGRLQKRLPLPLPAPTAAAMASAPPRTLTANFVITVRSVTCS